MIFSYDETFVATGFLVKGLKTIFTTAHSLSGAEMVEIKFPGKRKSMRGPKDTAPSSYHNS